MRDYQVSPSPLPTRLPATFRFVKWINENIDNKETTEYIDALISHEIWLHCVLLLIITMHQHDETPQAHIVGKRDPGPYSSSSTGQCVMFCKGQHDTSAVTPIAKLVPQNRSLLIPRPRHPAAAAAALCPMFVSSPRLSSLQQRQNLAGLRKM